MFLTKNLINLLEEIGENVEERYVLEPKLTELIDLFKQFEIDDAKPVLKESKNLDIKKRKLNSPLKMSPLNESNMLTSPMKSTNASKTNESPAKVIKRPFKAVNKENMENL